MRVQVMRAFKGTRPVKCAYCEKTFWTIEDAIKHEQSRHKRMVEKRMRDNATHDSTKG
jgi:hypothetical protein